MTARTTPKVSAQSHRPSIFPLCPLASCKLVFKEFVLFFKFEVGIDVASVACKRAKAPHSPGVSSVCKPRGGGHGRGLPSVSRLQDPCRPSAPARLWGQQPGAQSRRCPWRSGRLGEGPEKAPDPAQRWRKGHRGWPSTARGRARRERAHRRRTCCSRRPRGGVVVAGGRGSGGEGPEGEGASGAAGAAPSTPKLLSAFSL